MRDLPIEIWLYFLMVHFLQMMSKKIEMGIELPAAKFVCNLT